MIRHFINPYTRDYLYSADCPDDTPFTTAIPLPEYDATLKPNLNGEEWLLIDVKPPTQLLNGSILASEEYESRNDLLKLRFKIFNQHDMESLLGKTSNALAATLNLQMQIYQRLAQAQTLEDVRAAVALALPLMQRVGLMLKAGELLSVQHAQGLSDNEAIIEALEAMTQVARVIRDFKQPESGDGLIPTS